MRPLRAAVAITLGLAGLVVAAPAANAIEEGSTVSLAIAVPLTVGPGSSGLISSEELEAYTRPLGELTRQLDAVIDRPVAIAIDPKIIVSIRILGTSAPASATLWLSRLAGASNETFALPYSDTDATLATQAGSPHVLQPPAFDFAIDPALFGPATTKTPTPSPTPTPTETPNPDVAPTLPTSDALAAWPYTLQGLGWPRSNSVIASDLAPLSAAWDSIILSSGNVAGTASSVVTIDKTRALVSNDTVSAALAATVTAVNPEGWSTSFAALDQSLSAAADTQGDAGTVLATLDRGVLAEGSLVSETIDQLTATPGVTIVPLSTLAAGASAEATLVDKPQDPARIGVTQQLLAAATDEQQFSSIVENPDVLIAPRRLQVLALTSNAWLANPNGWSAATAEFLTESKELLGSVQVVESSSFNLLADNAGLPISVSNTLNQAVTVYITVRPDTALLAVLDNRVKLVVEANSQGKGPVPVQAISNGTVRALVTLSSGTGVPIGDPTTAKINVQAGWETPIAVVLAALVIGVFGFGIVRRIVRRNEPTADLEPND